MKYIICIFLLSLGFISCEEVFKENPQNNLKLNTLSDYNEAMAGLYNRLFYCIMGNKLIYLSSIANEDDMNVRPHTSNRESLDIEPLYSLKTTIFPFECTNCDDFNYSITYNLLFQTIGIANDILFKAGEINNLSAEIKSIIGEVYFIRAYSYYRLIRMYGQVPIIDNPHVNFTLKKASLEQLFHFIEKDFLKSIELLPESSYKARIKFETPNKGSAKAILAEVYLTMGGFPLNDHSKYAIAAKIAKEVIDSSDFYGIDIEPDLANLWNGKNSHNLESVFSLYLIKASIDLSNENDVYNNELFTFNGNSGLGTKFNNSSVRQYCDVVVAPVFYNNFPKSYRKEVSFHTYHVPNNTHFAFDQITQTNKFQYDSIYLKHYDTINFSTNISFKKFYTQFSIADTLFLNNPNLKGSQINPTIYGHYLGEVVYIFRFAQTLLTYAEAKAYIGEVDASAYKAINKIRRRANNVNLNSPSPYDLRSGLSQKQFLDSVIQERAWELCAEPEGRWFDIMRLNLTSKLVEIKHKQKIIVYPIPTVNNNFYLPIPDKD